MSTDATELPPLLLTVEEAAMRLGVGRSTMYTLVLNGHVESILIGRLRRIPTDALPNYLQRLRQQQTSSTNRLSA